jgi:mono/diheme cytochrome c family protein
MKRSVQRNRAIPLTWAAAVTVVVFSGTSAAAQEDAAMAKTVFQKRCTACHTYGKGVKVGPDLKGVTVRRKREWLLQFISSSSKMIESRDTTAVKLFSEFRRERMPDWGDELTPPQIAAILDYFAADGPEQKGPDERGALTATATEIEAGRKLFHGTAPFTYGGRACHSCHTIRGGEPIRDGNLGPELTPVYSKYQDKALTDFLKHLCSPWSSGAPSESYPTPQEGFNLKAYLAQAAGMPIPMPGSGPARDLKNSQSRISH